MTKFYSKSAGGFFDTTVHGSRKLMVLDPSWIRPLIDVTLQPGDSFTFIDGSTTKNDGETPVVIKDVPDPSAIPATVMIDNPDCKIPPDGVEITDEMHALLLEGQADGKFIVADENGAPKLVERPTIPFSERREAYFNEEVRALRDVILNRLVGIGWVVNGDDVTMVEAIKRARVDLLDITKHPTVLAATNMTDLRQAVKVEYKRIVAAAPASLRSAFNGMSA